MTEAEMYARLKQAMCLIRGVRAECLPESVLALKLRDVMVPLYCALEYGCFDGHRELVQVAVDSDGPPEWVEGQQAYLNRLALKDNPYTDDPYATLWSLGYIRQREEARKSSPDQPMPDYEGGFSYPVE